MKVSFRFAAAILCLAAFAAAGCSAPAIDIAKDIKVGGITTGWFDAGIVDGKNKLVPSASFTVTNRSGARLSGLQVYCVFRFPNDQEELGSSFVVLRGADALEAGATSKPITVRATWGFTGEQPRAQMLMNQYFQDAKVEIYAKFGAGAFVKLEEVPVSRQLLTH
jgi:hypothetical protein